MYITVCSSINPQINMGQVEGAFTFGVGMHLLEQVKYDPITGENFTKDIMVSNWVIQYQSNTVFRVLCNRHTCNNSHNNAFDICKIHRCLP